MSPEDLDATYSALCEAMSRVGEQRAPMLLAALCLSLMTRHGDADEVKALIQQAETASVL
ncbi:MAG: hypothetical protein M0R28_18290 [Pigmentiphaga sp.]|nr:hypothetical protein [Pigmentiphaga sp.]